MNIKSYILRQNIKSRVKYIYKAFVNKDVETKISFSDAVDLLGSEIETFIQIGANDGLKNDLLNKAIKKFTLKGILIEPFPPNINKLKENYKEYKKLIFENCGISDTDAKLTYFYIKDIKPEEPDWYDQVGSFDQSTFEKNISVVPGLTDRVGNLSIPCLTVESLLEKYEFKQVDLMLIDAEGFDYRILLSIDMEKCAPKVIIFEVDWMTHYEFRTISKKLVSYDYTIYRNGMDCMALKLNP